jgi:hypothetical protein
VAVAAASEAGLADQATKHKIEIPTPYGGTKEQLKPIFLGCLLSALYSSSMKLVGMKMVLPEIYFHPHGWPIGHGGFFRRKSWCAFVSCVSKLSVISKY